MRELTTDSNGYLVWVDTSELGILTDRAVSGHWRLKRGTPVVLDQRGTIRFRAEVHSCAICTLWYDAYDMNENYNAHSGKTYFTYCRHCWRDYCKWRQAIVANEGLTKTRQDKSVRTFRRKYLAGTLVMSPLAQVDRHTQL